MKRALFGLEFIAGVLAIVVAAVVVGSTLGSATLVRAAIEKARSDSAASSNQPQLSALVAHGQKLFAVNCSHCHADDATGDEGPDLHGLTKSDERIKGIITNGIKGEMPAFGKKLQEADKDALLGFLRSLK
ncbi:MAG: cytochrome c [Verrucomicrobia bacterium]|nr:cytochrome c [Verrucomicrobiota bacterium]MBV8276702.1 cytochrome c [Verrucomicrobiota bacterium]